MAFTLVRVGIPNPGRQAEALKLAKARAENVKKTFGTDAKVQLRFGGPVGEVILIETFNSLDEIQEHKLAVIKHDSENKEHTAAVTGVFKHIEETVWADV